MTRFIQPLFLLIIVGTLLVGCGGQAAPTPISPEAIFTSAAQTVAAQLTETAISWTPTLEVSATYTSTPTSTLPAGTAELTLTPSLLGTPTGAFFTPFPSPTTFTFSTPSGPICDDAIFIGDTTIPDGTKLKPGEAFFKIWRVKNTGICTWDEGYGLAFAYGDQMGGAAFIIARKEDFVEPNQVKDMGVNLTAPTKPGQYIGHWRLMNDRGYFFGIDMTVVIEVVKK